MDSRKTTIPFNTAMIPELIDTSEPTVNTAISAARLISPLSIRSPYKSPTHDTVICLTHSDAKSNFLGLRKSAARAIVIGFTPTVAISDKDKASLPCDDFNDDWLSAYYYQEFMRLLNGEPPLTNNVLQIFDSAINKDNAIDVSASRMPIKTDKIEAVYCEGNLGGGTLKKYMPLRFIHQIILDIPNLQQAAEFKPEKSLLPELSSVDRGVITPKLAIKRVMLYTGTSEFKLAFAEEAVKKQYEIYGNSLSEYVGYQEKGELASPNTWLKRTSSIYGSTGSTPTPVWRDRTPGLCRGGGYCEVAAASSASIKTVTTTVQTVVLTDITETRTARGAGVAVTLGESVVPTSASKDITDRIDEESRGPRVQAVETSGSSCCPLWNFIRKGQKASTTSTVCDINLSGSGNK